MPRRKAVAGREAGFSSPARSSGTNASTSGDLKVLTTDSVTDRTMTTNTTPSVSKRGRPRKSIEAKEEKSDDDLASDHLMIGLDGNESDEKPLSKTHSKKVLKEVSVPLANPTKRSSLGKRKQSSPSPSTVGSSRSAGRDQSSEYYTPMTSAVATPAESMTKAEPSIRRRGRPAKAMINADHLSFSGKRKRLDKEDIEEEDAALARALQAEEYGDRDSGPAVAKRPSKRIIKNSSDIESELSALSEAESSADEGPLIKKAKSNQRTALPSRRARTAARGSLAQNARLVIDDSEEDDESDFSLLDSEAAELDDEDEDGLSTANATPAPDGQIADAATATVPARRRRRRNMAGASADRRAQWNERRLAGLSARVGSISCSIVSVTNQV